MGPVSAQIELNEETETEPCPLLERTQQDLERGNAEEDRETKIELHVSLKTSQFSKKNQTLKLKDKLFSNKVGLVAIKVENMPKLKPNILKKKFKQMLLGQRQ